LTGQNYLYPPKINSWLRPCWWGNRQRRKQRETVGDFTTVSCGRAMSWDTWCQLHQLSQSVDMLTD